MEEKKKIYQISTLTYFACAFFSGLAAVFKTEMKFKYFYIAVAAVFLIIAIVYFYKYLKVKV